MNNTTTLPPAPALPKVRDPIRLASVTVEAVDQIGESAAVEIEDAATALEFGAREIAEKLRALAGAVRQHSKIAGEHVNEFCGKATLVIEGVRDLQKRIDGEPDETPQFLQPRNNA